MSPHEAKLKCLKRALRNTTAHPAYVRWENGEITGVACKLCGNPISLRGRNLPAYREIAVQFDDGSNYITPLCAGCLSKGLGLADLEAIYCDDIKALALEGEEIGEEMYWRPWVERVPVSYRSVE